MYLYMNYIKIIYSNTTTHCAVTTIVNFHPCYICIFLIPYISPKGLCKQSRNGIFTCNNSITLFIGHQNVNYLNYMYL